MKLHCRACGAAIPSEVVDIDRAIARCSACDAVFGFADQLEPEQRASALRHRTRTEALRGLTLDRHGGGLVIHWRWLRPWVFFPVFICVVWDGFLVFWYRAMLAAEEPPLMLLVFPLPFVAVGVGLTYIVVCMFVNRTWIAVQSGQLDIRHGPLPWPGNHSMSAMDAAQLYCSQHVLRGRSGVTFSYSLSVVQRDGARRTLLVGLDDADHAIFVEQEIESYLGIEDRPVQRE